MPRRDDRPVDLHRIVLADALTREPVDLGEVGTRRLGVLTAIRHRA